MGLATLAKIALISNNFVRDVIRRLIASLSQGKRSHAALTQRVNGEVFSNARHREWLTVSARLIHGAGRVAL